MSAEPAVAADAVRRPARRRRSSASGSQLVVGLDPRLDLLPVELRGDAHLGRAAAAEATRALLLRDPRRGRAARRRRQAAARVLRGARRRRAARVRGRRAPTRASAGLLVIADAKRGDIGSTARAYADAYLEPRDDRAAARRRADRQPLPRPRLARAVPRRLPPRRRGHLLPRQDLERGRRRRPGPDALRRRGRSGSRSRRSSRELGEELVGERGLSSVGAVVGATHPRAVGEARRLLPQVDPAPARRRRAGRDARPTSPAPSRAVRRARSSPPRARSSTPSGKATTTGGAPRAPEAARLRREVWAVSGW